MTISQEKTSQDKTIFILLLILILGWATMPLTLFDVGRYSFPLILFAGIPFSFRMTYRSLSCLTLLIASGLFATLVGVIRGIQVTHMISQNALQVLAITFAAGIAAINWHKYMPSLERAIVIMGIPIVGYGCYQMAARLLHLPGAFLPVTNKQYYAEGGLQLGWEKSEITRASSFFSEPSEFGYYSLWLLVVGLSTENKAIRILAMSLAAAGLLAAQSLGAILGAFVIFAAYSFAQGVSRHLIRNLFLTALVFGGTMAGLNALAPEAFEQLTQRIGFAASFDERADSGRVDHLPACIELFKDSPVWGYGISALNAAGSTGSDITTINYMLVLMERGLVGGLLFFFPWFFLAFRAWLLPRNASGRTFSFLVMVMTICAFCDFSLTYFLPFWLAYGVAASLVLQTHAPTREKSSSQVSQPYHASFAS
jgi:hypothetical protein